MRAEQYVVIDGYVTWMVLVLPVIGGVLTLIIRWPGLALISPR